MKNVANTCIKLTDDSKIKFEENRKKIVFINTQRLRYKKVQVDGCAIKEGVRCDNLLVSEDEEDEYYVELKGKDIKHALEQIERTITMIGEHHNKRISYIICSNRAPHFDSYIQERAKSLWKQYRSKLIIRERFYMVELS